MDEYNNINWRENLLEDSSIFITDEDYEDSNINKILTGTLNVTKIRDEISTYNKRCKMKQDYPGSKFYFQNRQRSSFNTIEQQRLISALKVFQTGRTRLNRFEIADRELYTNMKQDIISENNKFVKNVEETWNSKDYPTGMKMNDYLYKYAITERMNKLSMILKLPKCYVPVDLLPWSYSDTDIAVEMTHTANILDVGVVSQYIPPLLVEPYKLDNRYLPELKENNYNSKLPISSDKNIEEYFTTGAADVAISLGALKKIMDYTETNQLWTIPVLIKNVPIQKDNNKRMKKVIFFDKPLLKQTISKVDLNERCHKLLVRSNFGCLEACRFPHQDKPIINNNGHELPNANTDDERILHNVAYKLWSLQQQSDETTSMMCKNRNMKSFKVLVRTKIHSCVPCGEVGYQAITVVPKLEYQLKFGANIFTRKELVNQWTDLYFRPGSLVQRVRTHYLTSEVVKIEPANLPKVNMEAMQHHNIKTHLGLGVLYKLLLGLETHPEGFYLLRHEIKNGAFVALFKRTDDDLSPNLFDLHQEYSTQTNIVDPYHKKWCPIDVNILLPAFENHGHFPGLFKPCEPIVKKPFQGKKGKKKKKKSLAKKKMAKGPQVQQSAN